MSEPQASNEPPLIERVQAKIANLERMMDWLDERIEGGQGSPASLNHDRANRSALKYALLALRHYDADMRGLDLPMLALAELVEAMEPVLDTFYDEGHEDERAKDALDRARACAKEWTDGT